MPRTKKETEEMEARVKAVEDAIAKAKLARDRKELKGIYETEEDKSNRLAKEAKDLADAGANEFDPAFPLAEKTSAEVIEEARLAEIAKDLKIHTDARDARVDAVKKSIAVAKVARDEQETTGLIETEGVKLDRLAKEAKDLRDASVLNVIEPGSVNSNNLDVQALADKLSEVIKFLNLSGQMETFDFDEEPAKLEELSKNELKALAVEKGLELEGDESKGELLAALINKLEEEKAAFNANENEY